MKDPYDVDVKDELESLSEEGQAALAAQPNSTSVAQNSTLNETTSILESV